MKHGEISVKRREIIMEENKTEVSTENISTETVTTTETTKKKSKFPVVLVLILAFVAIIAVVVALNFKVVKNTIKKATLSDEAYAQYILKENAKQGAEFYGNMYDKNILSIFKDNIDATSTISFQITEDGFDFLEDNDVDVDEIEDIEIFKDKMALNYTCKHDGDLSFISFGYSSGKESLASAELLFDKANQMVYIRFPEFGSDYAALDLEDFYDDDEIDDLFAIIDSIDEIGNILIPADQLVSIIERYQGVIIEKIDDVEISKETLEVGDLEQKVTAIEFEMDVEKLAEIVVAVAEEFVDDEEIMQIVENISEIEYIEDADEFVEDYEQFLEELEDELDDIDEELEDSDEEGSVTFTLYVDNKGEVIGSKMYFYSEYSYETYDWDKDDYITREVEDEMEFFCGYIVKGGKFALEMYADENGNREMSVTGEGKAKGTKLSGEFTAEVDDEELELNIDDLDWTKWSQGIVDAKISINFDQFGKEVPKQLRDLSIVITINGSKNTYGVSLCEDDTLLMTAELTNTLNNNAKISVPKNVVEVTDADDIADYIEDLDFSKLEDIIDDMDLPIDTDDIVEELAEGVGVFVEDSLPIEILLVPEIGVPANPYIPVLAGIMAPQMIRYIQHANRY